MVRKREKKLLNEALCNCTLKQIFGFSKCRLMQEGVQDVSNHQQRLKNKSSLKPMSPSVVCICTCHFLNILIVQAAKEHTTTALPS